ncbi:hypothetical protein MY11210_003592 [Beauveria gryllotalpidicola]
MPSGSNKLFVPFLVLAMLVTGVANILLAKYQDQQCVRHCSDADVGRRETFKQPAIQTAQMFIGEAGCWLVAKGTAVVSRRLVTGLARSRGYAAVVTTTTDANETSVVAPTSSTWRGSSSSGGGGGGGGAQQPRSRTGRILLLAVPTLFDICGTTLMNAGLLFTAPSLYQMMRGLVVLFVGCFSFICFRRRLRSAQYVGIVGVVLGVAIAGTAGILDAPDTASGALVPTNAAYTTIIGILLIAGAQTFTASQLVVEEWILAGGSRLQTIDVVGYEGLLGMLFMTAIFIALYLALGQSGTGRLGPLDILEGWRQLTTVKSVLVSGILVTISVGLSNFLGLAVTKQLSATSRSTIDTSRTFFIWILSLSFGWETFKWLQAVGFFVLIYSTLLFHEIVPLPCVDHEGLQTRG